MILSSRRTFLTGALAGLSMGAVGCSVLSPYSELPRLKSSGSRAREFESISSLVELASAVVVTKPTGTEYSKALPAEYRESDSAPAQFVVMHVSQVVRGVLRGSSIDVGSLRVDPKTGGPEMVSGGPYLLFITPAMYGPNDPAGGYVTVGGSAGIYSQTGAMTFSRLDSESPKLPTSIDLSTDRIPKVRWTEEQLVSAGPGQVPR